MPLQASLREEWGPFKGLYGNVNDSAIPHGYAAQASNVLLDNGCLEVAYGDANASVWDDAGNVSGSQRHSSFITLPANDFGATSDSLLSFTSAYWRKGTTIIGYATGTAAVTNGSANVTGSGTAWASLSGSGATLFFKSLAASDTTYVQIDSITNNTALVLAANWSGSTDAALTYRIAFKLVPSASYPIGRSCVVVFNGYAIMSDGTNSMFTYDGSTQLPRNNNPLVRCLEIHKRRVFGANTTGSPHQLSWSAANDVTTDWNASADMEVFPKDGGDAIVALKSYRNRLFVFKKTNGLIYEVRGNFDTTIGAADEVVKVTSLTGIGVIYPKTIIEWKGILYFLATTGLYAFDGSSLQLVTKAFENQLTELETENNTTLDDNLAMAFSVIYQDRMFINVTTQADSKPTFFIVDKDFNVVKQTTNATARTIAGNFTLARTSTTDATWIAHVLRGVTSYMQFFTSASYTRFTSGSTENVDHSGSCIYESEVSYQGIPEYQKDYYKFYVVFEETSATSSFLFSYSVDNMTYSSATTVTVTGTAGKINVAEIPIYMPNNIANARGRGIQWKITGNNLGATWKVFKVMLRYEPLTLR